MKARPTILLAAVVCVFLSEETSAVPPMHVDASSVTVLSDEGTPDVLLRKARVFETEIWQINSAADAKHAQLRRQLVSGLEHAAQKAQSDGDIDAVLALKGAMENLDRLTDSDIQVVKTAIVFRDRKTAEIEQARKTSALNAARSFNERLDTTKRDETKKGNFETAKAIGEYQKQLRNWARNLPTTAASAPEKENSTNRHFPEKNEAPPRVMPTFVPNRASELESFRDVVVPADNPKGGSMGRARSGERFLVQYQSGTWTHWKSHLDQRSPNEPSSANNHESLAVIVDVDSPNTILAVVPPGSGSRPFEFVVERDGAFVLRINDGEGQRNYVDNEGEVRYRVQRKPGNRSPKAPSRPLSANLDIPANRFQGTKIGSLKSGDRIILQYVSGVWTHWKGSAPYVSPDEGGMRLALYRESPHYANSASVPYGTVREPFSYTVPVDGTYYLRGDGGPFEDIFPDNDGGVRYRVEIVPAGAVPRTSFRTDAHEADPSPRFASSPASAGSTIVPNSGGDRIATIDATDDAGPIVAENARRGDRIVLRYRGGTWRSGGLDWSPDESPDGIRLTKKENAVAIARVNPLWNTRETAATLPAGTADKPFVFVVEREGTYRLRINDSIVDDNHGSVQYDVSVVRSGLPGGPRHFSPSEHVTSAPGGGERLTVMVGDVPLHLRWCPPGSFQMGSETDEYGHEDRETRHRVTLTRGFWMAETETTQALWWQLMGNNPSAFPTGDDYPAENMTWTDVQSFLERLNDRIGSPKEGYRFALPSEAQWEYACRAGGTGAYSFVGDISDYAWFSGNSGSRPHSVAKKKPNPWGLYDMHGNVWEFCQDRFAPLPADDETDPTGPRSTPHRVLKGGSYNYPSASCRSAQRDPVSEGWHVSSQGFRVALVSIP